MVSLIDFDGHVDMFKDEPIEMKVRGKTYELPADIPMAYMIMAQQDVDREHLDENIYALIALVFGQEEVEGWLRDGMTRKEYLKLVELVCGHYFGKMAENADGGEEDPKAPTSS